MSICTWHYCKEPATHPQRDGEGRVWANLCKPHDEFLKKACETGVQQALTAWVRASGGATKLASRM